MNTRRQGRGREKARVMTGGGEEVRWMRALIEEYKKRLGRDFTDEERELMVRLICDHMFNVRDTTRNQIPRGIR